MGKTSIKVIKRKDAQPMANMEPQNACEPKQTAPVSEEKIERRSRREIVDTVSSWISERREKNRHEEIAAIRKIFGNEPLLGEI
ncbi:MAG: hypothetical protein M3209_11570 [Acidobacteriota bacterium]|nr:hypothetical protein [Acidobacteriota bacterium]